MPKEFQRENRYVVFKRSDMRKYLSQSECKQVEGLALHICLSRECDGKHPLNCLIVEPDWPEFEPTWGAIEARVTGAEQPTSRRSPHQAEQGTYGGESMTHETKQNEVAGDWARR